jgi:lipopolysaccharide biosynthesis glycosyltransferase
MRALVFSLDDAYVMPFKVLWHSLMKTESVPYEVPVFILHAETLSPDSIRNVAEFLKKYGYTANFNDARSYVPDDVPLSHHITKASYYRLFVASILPEEVTSAVYLDSDAVVLQSLREIFEVPLTSPIAAADHMAPYHAYRLWGSLVGSYFQAGVILVDLIYWRLNQLDKTFKLILSNERSRLVGWDQDVLNIVFENDWQRLPIWFNLSQLVRSEIPQEDVKKNGRFLHLDGGGKPWKYYSKDWEADFWYTIYFEAFGEKFQKASIQRPIWKRSLSVLNRIIECARGRT